MRSGKQSGRRSGNQPSGAMHAVLVVLTLLPMASVGCGGKDDSVASQSAEGKNAEGKNADAALAPIVQQYWEASFIGTTKVGQSHTKVTHEVDAGGETHVRTTSKQQLRLSRNGDVADQRLHLETLEHEGKLLEAFCDISSQQVSNQSRCVVKDDTLEITLKTAGREKTVTAPWGPRDRGYFALQQSLANKPLAAGETRTIRSLMAGANAVAELQLQAGQEKQTVDMLGETAQRELLEIKIRMRIGETTLRQVVWADGEGQVWKQFDPQVNLMTFRTTEEIATAASDGVFQFDNVVFVKATGVPLASPHQKRRAVYRVTVRGDEPSNLFPSSPTQAVAKSQGEHAEIVVSKTAGPSLTLAPPEAADLSPNALIQSDAPLIREMAMQVAAQERDALRIAVALESLVHDKVEQKDYSRAFDSALDVARQLQGDCTEHAVLLAALCRARGVPARVVSGLVAFRNGFAYHMWTEVHDGNGWVALDATLGRGEIGVGHIKLVDSNLSGANSFSALLPVLQVIGRIEIEVISLQ